MTQTNQPTNAEQRPPNCGTGFCSCINCPYTWAKAEEISNMPDVDEAIRALLDDNTADNATAVVQAVLAATALPVQQTQAATDVLAERCRQIEAEGWTSAHDDEHLMRGSLAAAAACYALSAAGLKNAAPSGWPWSIEWWKPTTPRRDLVKAGALILAEIERLDRISAAKGNQS